MENVDFIIPNIHFKYVIYTEDIYVGDILYEYKENLYIKISNFNNIDINKNYYVSLEHLKKEDFDMENCELISVCEVQELKSYNMNV